MVILSDYISNPKIAVMLTFSVDKAYRNQKKKEKLGNDEPLFLFCRLLRPLVFEPSRRESDLKLNTDRAVFFFVMEISWKQHRSKSYRFFFTVLACPHTQTKCAIVLLSFVQIFK